MPLSVLIINIGATWHLPDLELLACRRDHVQTASHCLAVWSGLQKSCPSGLFSHQLGFGEFLQRPYSVAHAEGVQFWLCHSIVFAQPNCFCFVQSMHLTIRLGWSMIMTRCCFQHELYNEGLSCCLLSDFAEAAAFAELRMLVEFGEFSRRADSSAIADHFQVVLLQELEHSDGESRCVAGSEYNQQQQRLLVSWTVLAFLLHVPTTTALARIDSHASAEVDVRRATAADGVIGNLANVKFVLGTVVAYAAVVPGVAVRGTVAFRLAVAYVCRQCPGDAVLVFASTYPVLRHVSLYP